MHDETIKYRTEFDSHGWRYEFRGECDRCHHEKGLCEDLQEPGEFAYCRACWRYYVERGLMKPDCDEFTGRKDNR